MNRRETIKQLLKASNKLTAEHGHWLKEKNYKGMPHACIISSPDARDKQMIQEIAEATGIKFVVVEVATLRDMKKYWDNLSNQGTLSQQEYEAKCLEYSKN